MNADGGPAFPTSNGGSPDDGMTLRDYFAAKAMQSYLSSNEWRLDMDGPSTARAAYQMADYMLKARQE